MPIQQLGSNLEVFVFESVNGWQLSTFQVNISKSQPNFKRINSIEHIPLFHIPKQYIKRTT